MGKLEYDPSAGATGKAGDKTMGDNPALSNGTSPIARGLIILE